jgi:hypothetical protein
VLAVVRGSTGTFSQASGRRTDPNALLAEPIAMKLSFDSGEKYDLINQLNPIGFT